MKELTTKAFASEVLRAVEPVVVVFAASWCPFCRAFSPIMQRQVADLPWPVMAVMLDDMDDPLWDRYKIEVVPTIAVFEQGQLVFRVDGVLGDGLAQKDIVRLKGYIIVRGRGGVSRSR